MLDPISDITVSEGATITISPTATDPDGDALTYTYSGWMTSNSYTTNYNESGTHTVTVTVSDGTLTDSQDVTITVTTEFFQYYEAEDMILVSPMLIGSDTNATGGQYINPTTGTDSTSPQREASLNLTLTETGTYYLWVRIMGPTGLSDALYVGIDATWDRVYPNATNGYEWVKVETSNGSGNYDFNLTQGNHTFQIGHGEINARADTLFLTNDSNEIPISDVDTIQPSTPANFQATAISTSQINLSWNASTDNIGVTGYRIYRESTQIATTSNTTYQDTGLSSSTTYSYTVSAYDAAGNESGQSSASSATTLSLPVNNPPVLSPVGNKSVNEGQALSFTISATDPDGDTLIYTTNNLPSGASFNGNTKTFAWTPTNNQAGTYSNITFQVSDGIDIDSVSITITVGNINRSPVLNSIANITVSEGVTITLSPTATDPDGDALTYTYSGWMTSNSYTTNYNDSGTHTVTVTVSDGTLTDSQDVTVTVSDINRPPVLDQISDITVSEGATITLSPTATDPDGDALTYSYSGWMSSASYTTDNNDAGSHTVTVTVSDGSLIDSQDVMVTIIDVDSTAPAPEIPTGMSIIGT